MPNLQPQILRWIKLIGKKKRIHFASLFQIYGSDF